MKLKFLLIGVVVVLLTSVTALAQAEPIQIEFWSLLTGSQADILQQHITQFNELHDDIEVTYVSQGGYAELQQKLLASVSAGNTPAVTMVDYGFVPLYAQNGVFAPLNPFFTEEDEADLIPGLLADLTYEGQVYALPYNRSTQGFYYNADLLAEFGFEPAQTWEEFAEQARAIHAANPEYYGGYAYANAWEFAPVILGWGGRFNDDECNVTLNEPEVVGAINFFKDLNAEGAMTLPNALDGSLEEVNSDFVQGRVAYLIKSTSWLTRLGSVVDFAWDFTMMPAGPNGRFVTNGGANLAISAAASPEVQAASWELIRYLTDTEQTGEFHVSTGYMPVRYSALELPAVQELHAEFPRYRLSIDQLEYATATACVARNVSQYVGVVNEALQRVWINGEDTQAVFDQVTADLQDVIDEMKADGTLVN